ncbi:phosphopantetheine-binding protein [Bacillus subtilis]|uniref:phosphopantetheine-binding protein n=1 Tax=Bacillus subtilis TaxID=1423 RepID=UPI002149E4C2|nr:phosphopantetheine-binding protein [Bacillus subtilis]MCR1991745.1 phosphopantetheine-binding protein [Bacillus subtilis]
MNSKGLSTEDIRVVEETLRKHPAVDEVLATLSKEENADKIVVYILGEENKIKSNQLLESFSKKNLAEHLIPADYVWVENVQKFIEEKGDANLNFITRNKKENVVYQLPRTKTEKQIHGIWREVLNKTEIGIKEVFFEIGGDSMKCSQVFYLINDQYPDTVSLVDLFKYNTIESLSLYIDELKHSEHKDDLEGFTL